MDFAAVLIWTLLRAADLQPPRITEAVTVTSRPSGIATPAAVTTLRVEELQRTPALALDDALRSVPGFSLFRRSSSRVANPTTQGATLRGLAASGASRALVLADDVPLNDPFGGWVYWNRVPAAALQEVAVARGASGNEHGADAIGGVVAIHTSRTAGGRLMADGGSHSTARLSAFAGRDLAAGFLSGAVEAFTTAGYPIVAPESRGLVDERAASRHAAAYAVFHSPPRAFTVTASHLRESRRNGTPLQRNATHVSHAAAAVGGEVGASGGWHARAYASVQEYEQTFSAVGAGRISERLTSEQFVGANSAGSVAEYWWKPRQRRLEFSSELGMRRVAADMREAAFGMAGERLESTTVDASQWGLAASARSLYRLTRFTAGGAIRTELWHSGSSRYVVTLPRLWLTAAPRNTVTVTVALQSGFRPPTLNELHRPFRVGNVVTDANAALRPEGSRGLEAGAVWHLRQATVRALAFWSRVEDAIVNVTLSGGADVIRRQRQNAARIRAAGTELELEARAGRALTVFVSSSLTDSRFVAGPLEQLRVPQVPRFQHAAGARVAARRLRASAAWRHSGPQFDDDRNAFELRGSSMVDARAGWMLRRGVEVFGAVENLLDTEQDVGRTPLRTVGLPRTV
ncbi:MAG TPA: TonB-dependent receptor, partial [Vicinamibacterales bacterium]|nr:TonB-dependent receptor [Vicinamibacterales bacterium]